jgi:small subunit ribosomal protein S4
MARYREPVCRLCRREGQKLFLKGERCYTPKCSFDRRGYPPGQHGQERQKLSEYGLHLREKQKARRIYGVLERQFRRYVELAQKARGVTGETLLKLLERRLDNVVYRLGFASSRAEARQVVRHGHIEVNGRRVDIPSYLVRPGEEISVRENSLRLPRFQELRELARDRVPPAWLEMVDPERMRARVIRLPEREEIDSPIREQLIVEYYAR